MIIPSHHHQRAQQQQRVRPDKGAAALQNRLLNYSSLLHARLRFSCAEAMPRVRLLTSVKEATHLNQDIHKSAWSCLLHLFKLFDYLPRYATAHPSTVHVLKSTRAAGRLHES